MGTNFWDIGAKAIRQLKLPLVQGTNHLAIMDKTLVQGSVPVRAAVIQGVETFRLVKKTDLFALKAQAVTLTDGQACQGQLSFSKRHNTYFKFVWNDGKGNIGGMTSAFAPWWGIFETVRVVKGIPLFMDEHERVWQEGAQALGLALVGNPRLEAKSLPRQSGRWRWILRSSGIEFLFNEEKTVPAEPIELEISPLRLGSQNWDARFKTLSYLTHAQAKAQATTEEVILRNEHGHVASAASANLFWRIGDCLYTPALETGCRRGVVREFVLKQGGVEQGHFSVDHLAQAEEIFLTSSLRGIVSVQKWGEKTLPTFPMSEMLCRHYQFEIRRQLDE